jgi:large subunit ribosomal protein L24
MRGAGGADAQVDARLTAGGLVAGAKGTARLFGANGLGAALDLTLQAADMSPLRRGAAARATTLLPVALRARLSATADEIALDNITGAVAGAPVRGKLKLAALQRIEGQIDADAADAMALLAIVTGTPRAARTDNAVWPGEPFGESLFGDLEGRVGFSAARAALSPVLTARQLRATLRLGAGEVAIENLEATLAGGRAGGQIVLRRTADGLALRAKMSLTGADAAALLAGEGRPAVTGRVALRAEVEGSGLSPASLIGSLSGTGKIELEDAQLSGLDPRAFNAAIRAVDQGLVIDAPKVRDIVATVLDGGALALPRLDAAVAIGAGQARIGQTVAYGQGADLSFTAGTDLADGSADARLILSGPVITEGSSTTRPEILVTLKGPLFTPQRSIDVSTLSGWLMLRSVERQAKRLDVIEAERRDAERRETERRDAERREAERREAERREAERRETERREAERRDAERREAERRDAEARSLTATVPTRLPAPIIMEEGPLARPARPLRPTTPQTRPAERAPALPPPLNIGPTPGASGKSGRAPGSPGVATASGQPPAARSALDFLIGVQR